MTDPHAAPPPPPPDSPAPPPGPPPAVTPARPPRRGRSLLGLFFGASLAFNLLALLVVACC